MKRCLMLLFAALLLVGSVHGVVEKLTIEQFEEVTAHHASPNRPADSSSNFWIIRFHVPWDTEADPSLKAAAEVFEAVSNKIPPSLARFGEIDVDSLESIALINGLLIENIPAIRPFGGRVGRPTVAKGAPITARPWYFEQRSEFNGDQSDPEQLMRFILGAAPSRFVDPLTNRVHNSMITARSTNDIRAHWEAEGLPPSLPAAVVFTQDVWLNPVLLATWYAQGAAHGGRLQLFISTELALARHFGLQKLPNATYTAVAFTQEFAPVGPAADIADAAAIEKFMSTLALPAEQYTTRVADSLSLWRRGISLLFSPSSPVRKIDTKEQFLADIHDFKGVAVVFFLRESHRSFKANHFEVAKRVGEFSLHAHTASLSGEPLKGVPRIDAFWIDAEVHPEVAKAFRLVNVPTAVMLIPLQNGKIGCKSFPDAAKDLPSPQSIFKYLLSSELLEGKGVIEVDPSAVKFSPAARAEHLTVDLLDYAPDAEEHNLLTQMKPPPPKDGAGKQPDGDAPPEPKRKLTPKQEAKKKKKEEKRKAEIKEELDRKKREKEERIRKKAEETEVQRKHDIAEAKKRNAQKPKVKKPTVSPDEEAILEAKRRLDEEAKKPPKPPMDPAEVRKLWEEDGKRAAQLFVAVHGEDISIIDRLEATP